MKRRSLLPVLFLVPALGVLQALGCSKRDPLPEPVPVKVETIDLDGLRDRLDANREAGRISIVHFWGTWCGPCIEEFPDLSRMYARIESEKRFDFLAIAVDEKDLEKTAAFAEKNGARFVVYAAEAKDPWSFIKGFRPAWGGQIPSTFVYGPDGTLAIEHIGPVEDTRAFEKKLRDLLPQG